MRNDTFQMARHEMGDVSVLHHIHAVHRGAALPTFLHDDTGWPYRGPRWGTAVVRQVHVSFRGEVTLFLIL